MRLIFLAPFVVLSSFCLGQTNDGAMESCQEDLDYDGVIGVNDLMSLLASFGTDCSTYEEEIGCGTPIEYHGYEYQTVLIGDQCWFAENLRTELYLNGEEIPSGLDRETWCNAT